MKITKLVLSAAAALGFCALQAQALASISTTVYNSDLSVAITVFTNKATVDLSTNTTHSGVVSGKIGNKQLLDLFAAWAGADRTTQPWKSAKLVVGWDHEYDILVVDKTGTNVLYDATSTGNDSIGFYVDFFDEYGAGDWTEKTGTSGYYTVDDTDSADWYLYDEDVTLPYTYLWGNGFNHQITSTSYTPTSAHWSDSEHAVFGPQGDQYWLDVGYYSSTSADFVATGGGKGEEYIGWAD
jgi:hypothetical protein